MSLQKALGLIKKSKVFLISTHLNPEADGIGAELAFLSLLKSIGKQGFIVNESGIPPECRFLPGIERIQPLPKAAPKFDCAVFLDCSEASRAGKVAHMCAEHSPTLNIDHHISNTRFANVNWVEAKASSTCEMVYRLYGKLKAPMDIDTALMLYAGIVVDTGSFRYNSTNSLSHRIAASFIDKGIRPALVYNRLFENNSFNDIQSLARILSRIKCSAKGKIVWAVITGNAAGHSHPSADLAEMVLGLMRSIKGIELAIVFKEIKGKKNRLRVNFRSQTNFDCNYLASYFGGGGHRNASGATIAGELAKVQHQVLGRARALMKRR